MSTITAEDCAEVPDKGFHEGISELSSRSANGLDVALLWQQCDNTAFVVVVDHRTGEAFRLDVGEKTTRLTCSTTPTHTRTQRIEVPITAGRHSAKGFGSRHEAEVRL